MQAKVKKAKRMGRKRATTMIDWKRLESEIGTVFEPTALARKAEVDTRLVSKSKSNPPEPVMRSKAFEIVKATGIDRPLDYIYDIHDGKSEAELKIGSSLKGWEVIEFHGGDSVRDISFKVGKVYDKATDRFGRCKVFDLDFDTESREFIAEELARNPTICHRVERNSSFPILYEHGFATADKYWVVENWEDVATLDRLVEFSGIKAADVPRIAKELAKAILTLNDAGVVVRCLSPKMVCRREDGSLLIRDFELATFLGPTSSGKLRERHNVYYADEFDLPDVDYRADMYSWAQIVIFCLTGRRPPSRPTAEFFASLPVKKSVYSVLSACSELNRDFRKWNTNKNGDFNFAEILDAIKGWSE